jgi:hypothetical protein
VLLGLAAIAGCGGRAVTPSATPSVAAAADSGAAGAAGTAGSAGPAEDPGIELPDGPGREILLSRCLGCHNLGGLALFEDFYTREDWHMLLQTMVAHGARVNAAELEVIADYLGLHYSREP